jgi:hypothetical protein
MGRRRVLRVIEVALLSIIVAAGVVWALGAARERNETARSTPRFDPPVWAGQNVPGACSGGFYARHEQTIVLTIVGHCATPGAALRDRDGRLIGIFGPLARLDHCPPGRFCSPSDFLTLELAADHIPWGHLNMVDLGVGGYRTFDPGVRALTCRDIRTGQRVEVDGREHYRSGLVIAIGPYEHATDTIFPCMIVTDISVAVGDSGGAVLLDGLPAGVTSRDMGGRLAFTPLSEGLENLGLTLCTTANCGLSPELAVQPSS